MDLALSDEQQALVAAFGDLLAKHSPIEGVRAAEPLGFDPVLWDALNEVGTTVMAVAPERGGWGAGLVDLVLVAGCLGTALASAPVIEAQCAARLLASLPAGAAERALQSVLDQQRLITLAVRPTRGARAELVPAGAVADAAVVLDGDRLLLVTLGDGHRTRVENLASAPLADVDIDASRSSCELARGAEALAHFEAALDEWLVLTAGALVGLGSAAHRITCSYACERQAWGQPIGAYQGVAHRLADGVTALDGARLLAAKAAWARDTGAPRGRELAAMAFGFAAETARDVTYDAVHFHGGYGFTLEHDAQLYYRRARGWARIWGEPRAAYRRAARARYASGADEPEH